jgi:enoyl-CoA hydratase/carnithine racemase
MREGTVADEIVLYEVNDKIGIITLNRPEKLNAISRELQLALTEAFARADADPATSVVLLACRRSYLLRRLRHRRPARGN